MPPKKIQTRSLYFKRCWAKLISCPTAWIDSKRNEYLSVTHNAITPVDEIVKNGLNVCIGSDNIFDIYKPFSDGDDDRIKTIRGNHFYNVNDLINIAFKL